MNLSRHVFRSQPLFIDFHSPLISMIYINFFFIGLFVIRDILPIFNLWCKLSILRVQLRRLIIRILRDFNGRQTLSKSFSFFFF